MKIVELPAARHAMAATLATWDTQGLDDASAIRHEAGMWKVAELYWVTPAMTRVALDASLDMPTFSLSELMPTDVGLLHYDGGLPALPAVSAPMVTDAFGAERYVEMPVDYLLWFRRGGVLHIGHGCLVERLDEAGFEPVKQPYVGMGTVDFPDYMTNINPAPDYVAPNQDDLLKTSIVMLLGATWAMMKQESVAESRVTQVQPTKNEVRKGVRPGSVTTVSLRRMRVVTTEHDDTGHKLTHRHVVRGHWRQQAWGPNQSLRRPTWVPSYVKGPEGAPLIRSEKVMVWRR